ncbi:MAG: hypothetical protein ACTSWI_00850 [Alphaproteobacteria bacterium]
MKYLGRIAVVAMLPLLAGCFNFVQSLSIAKDGVVTMVTEISLSTEMMALAFDGDDGDEFCPIAPDEELPPTFTITYEEFVRDEDTVCEVTAVGPIQDLAEAIATGALLPGADDDDDGAPVITLVDEGGGEFTYSLLFSSQGDPEAGPDEAAMMAMMAPLMEGRTLTWSVTAPRILSVNDEADNVTVDGKTATIVIPALDLVTEAGVDYALTVRFRL